MKPETKAGLESMAETPLFVAAAFVMIFSKFPYAVITGKASFTKAINDDYQNTPLYDGELNGVTNALNKGSAIIGAISCAAGLAAGCSAFGMGSASAWATGILVGGSVGILAGPCLIGVALGICAFAVAVSPFGMIACYNYGRKEEKERQQTLIQQQAAAAQTAAQKAQAAPNNAQIAAQKLQAAIKELPEDQRENFAEQIRRELKHEFGKTALPEEMKVKTGKPMFRIKLKKDNLFKQS